MGAVFAGAPGSADPADQEYRLIQDVVELTDPDAPVKLNQDGILAIHVALGLSNTEMEKMQGLLVPTLDPHGTGTLTRKAWRAVSAEWHASGKSFLDFVMTRWEATHTE